jgi:nicotinate-nucleotide pyrophosphorylase (carboxylating)
MPVKLPCQHAGWIHDAERPACCKQPRRRPAAASWAKPKRYYSRSLNLVRTSSTGLRLPATHSSSSPTARRRNAAALAAQLGGVATYATGPTQHNAPSCSFWVEALRSGIVIADFLLDEVVQRALAEDLSGGDVTSAAAVAEDERAIARAVAHSRLVVCGGNAFARAFYRVDPGLRVEERVAEGNRAEPGDVLWIAEGSARAILMAERTALNFAQRMSGVATLTRAFVDAVPAGSKLRIADTRKTTPGLRFLERYAVRVGGGHNHRDCLGSAVLIKDNHIVAAGGIRAAIERARAHAPHTSRIEIEVESLAQLDEALAAGAEIVMLDNFDSAALKEAVAKASGRALVEVSGGVTLTRVKELADLGVDVASVGALTHSAPAADIGLDIERIG